jgi:hypothetical protein
MKYILIPLSLYRVKRAAKRPFDFSDIYLTVKHHHSKGKEVKDGFFDKKKVYQLTDDLLRSIKDSAEAKLEAAGITPDIYEETNEDQERPGESISNPRPPPLDLAFTSDSTGRVPFDVYKTDADPCIFRVPCQSREHNKSSELTLTADHSEKQSTSALIFRLFEIQ